MFQTDTFLYFIFAILCFLPVPQEKRVHREDSQRRRVESHNEEAVRQLLLESAAHSITKHCYCHNKGKILHEAKHAK